MLRSRSHRKTKISGVDRVPDFLANFKHRAVYFGRRDLFFSFFLFFTAGWDESARSCPVEIEGSRLADNRSPMSSHRCSTSRWKRWDESCRETGKARIQSLLHGEIRARDLSPRSLALLVSALYPLRTGTVESPSASASASVAGRGAYRRASRTRSDISPIKDIRGLAITVAAAMPRGHGARYLSTLPVPYLAHNRQSHPREPRQPRRWRTERHPRVPHRVGVRCPRSGRGPIWLRPLFHHPVARLSHRDTSLASPSHSRYETRPRGRTRQDEAEGRRWRRRQRGSALARRVRSRRVATLTGGGDRTPFGCRAAATDTREANARACVARVERVVAK